LALREKKKRKIKCNFEVLKEEKRGTRTKRASRSKDRRKRKGIARRSQWGLQLKVHEAKRGTQG
jgi:hypothetical protein